MCRVDYFFGLVLASGGRCRNCRYPLADWLYRAGLVMKLESDMTSYARNAAQPRISFNDSLAVIRAFSEWTDNSTTVIHLVGWQGSGHDTLYPSLDRVDPNVGGGSFVFFVFFFPLCCR